MKTDALACQCQLVIRPDWMSRLFAAALANDESIALENVHVLLLGTTAASIADAYCWEAWAGLWLSANKKIVVDSYRV